MECYTLMFTKQRAQNHFHNKSTPDPTLLVDFYGCCMWHGLKLKVFEYKIICFTIGTILASSRGHMLMSSILCKIEYLWHINWVFWGYVNPLLKVQIMHLEKIKRNPVINEQHMDEFVYKQKLKYWN